MAVQSPLARFFKPVGTQAPAQSQAGPQTPARPQTPATSAAKGGLPDLGPGAVLPCKGDTELTPPSTAKRGPGVKAPVIAPEAKKPRRSSSKVSENTAGNLKPPAPTTGSDAPSGDVAMAPEPMPAPAPVSAAPPAGSAPAPLMNPLSDLGAALQQAQRFTPGSSSGVLPPFTAECFHHYNSGLQYQWPSWLKPDKLKDVEGRRPGDKNFDQSTLWVPDDVTQKQEGHGTPMLLQYWKLKRKHFDKVALFKVGKFYEIFYYDAFIANRVCELKWMNAEKKPHVGFPEVAKHQYAKQMVDAGYKVVVVEQVERVVEQKQRIEEMKGNGQKTKKEAQPEKTGPSCVEREACEIYTSGTLVDPELLSGANARYMMCLYFEPRNPTSGGAGHEGLAFAACLVDCATSQIQLGRMTDAPDRNNLRTLLAQSQPSEVVYSPTNLPSEVLSLLRRLPCRPQLSPITFCAHESQQVLAARERLQKYRTDFPEKLTHVEPVLSQDSAAVAAASAMEYLQSALLGQRVLPFAGWDMLDNSCSPESSVLATSSSDPSLNKRMVLDATAISALEVLETLEGTYKGSLLHYMDHTSTPHGHRMLRQWLCAPLYNAGGIRKRQEVVEFFLERRDLAKQISSGFKKVNIDLERITSRIWGFALQAERQAVMYEDITARRLNDFAGLLNAYEDCMKVVAQAFPPEPQSACPALPERLRQITRTQKHGGSFPELQPLIESLRGRVTTFNDEKTKKTKYRPVDGADPTYDHLCREIENIKVKLEKELQGMVSQHPKAGLHFVHRLPAYRYEVECEEGNVPAAFMKSVDMTTKTKNLVRFQTERIKELVNELDFMEDKREDCVFPFLARIFKEFHAHQAPFRAATRCLAELDVLLSLAATSQSLVGRNCRPAIVEPSGPEDTGCLELREGRHPVAAAKMGNSFVPNDTLMNTQGVANVLVVTGPNMGGKSTVLRQTCLAVIMAQLGCRVNAAVCRLTPVDRIFTRIGSYDTILEGKSTLLLELEETAAVIRHGTRRSLAVLDELGRGTSTFDGAAIASAVLDDLAHRLGCMVLFATHYHPVSREAVRSPQVSPFHMAAEVDERTNQMTFLYRFLPGLCPASHGHHVARLAGLPESVVKDALARSTEFEASGRSLANVISKNEKEKAAACGEPSAQLSANLKTLAEAGDAEGLRGLFRQMRDGQELQ